MNSTLRNVFFRSSAALLILTAIAKFISGTGSAAILDRPDPVFMIPYRHVFFVSGGIELAVALVCLFSKSLWLQSHLLAWLATQFFAYRLGGHWMNVHYCGCLRYVDRCAWNRGKHYQPNFIAYPLLLGYWELCYRCSMLLAEWEDILRSSVRADNIHSSE